MLLVGVLGDSIHRVTEYRGFELEVALVSTSEDMFDTWCTLDTHSTRPPSVMPVVDWDRAVNDGWTDLHPPQFQGVGPRAEILAWFRRIEGSNGRAGVR
ncbi:hypothetical protein DN412_34215 [Cupriavidus lacunae]|uniref:Uncharacterized protein n=1 Tax=Cupriavidus lacunae TaxID=2666307 RepID=A0A370NK01_9BURK|nr:hypothetical protein DN412_34215 [Cupriavidus lacunae]